MGSPIMKAAVLGIDIAKHIFHVHGVTATGHTVLRKKLSRPKLSGFLAQCEPCSIGLEACGSALYWAREIQKVGHDVRLISPQCVTPHFARCRLQGSSSGCDATRRCKVAQR